jgi:hypothetical protein
MHLAVQMISVTGTYWKSLGREDMFVEKAGV